MTTFVFRNQTVEPFWGDEGVLYSGYGDISVVPQDVDRYIWFYQVPVNADANQLSQEIVSFNDKLNLVLSRVADDKPFVIMSLVDLFPLRLSGDDTAVSDAIEEFNRRAVQLSKQRANIKYLDFSEFTNRYAEDMWINWKFYHMSQMLLNPKLANDFRVWWQRVEQEMSFNRKKCLVLDLDNTLWGGILGEDGIDGIKIGGDYPGNAYSYWQRSLLQLSKNGVILAICSKNNENDVIEAWENNPNMLLKREHFSSVRINWQDKVSNIRDIATELNIGLDSMVFIDDNPVECDLVKSLLPQVTVPDFPEKPYQLMPFFKDLVNRYFRIYAVTDEDKAKTEQYRTNAIRNSLQARFDNMEDFLRSLSMEIDIIPANEHNVPRIAQMTQKTNQFNLTTRRYSEADVHQRINQGWHIFCINVKDRFGDNGITGTVFLEPVDWNTVAIDSFLLSCRILGKGIDDVFIRMVLNWLHHEGIDRVTADYLPTAKNQQTATFYDRQGMECTHVDNDGSKHYEMTLQDDLEVKDYYNIRFL
jgi:FkbH-like protein